MSKFKIPPQKDNLTATVQARTDARTIKKLRSICREYKVKTSSVLRFLIHDYVARCEAMEGKKKR